MANQIPPPEDGETTVFGHLCTEALTEYMTPEGGINITAASQSLLSKVLIIANAQADHIMITKFPQAAEFNALVALVKSAHDLSENLAAPTPAGDSQ